MADKKSDDVIVKVEKFIQGYDDKLITLKPEGFKTQFFNDEKTESKCLTDWILKSIDLYDEYKNDPKNRKQAADACWSWIRRGYAINIIEEKSSDSIIIENTISVTSRNMSAMFFETTKKNGVCKVKIFSQVMEENLDIKFLLVTEEDFHKVEEYWNLHPQNPRNVPFGNIKMPPKPDIHKFFDDRNNHVDKDFELSNNVRYAWVMNNTYSSLTNKTIKTKIIIQTLSDKEHSKENLPITDLFKNKIPSSIYEDLEDANDCYVSNHFRQSAIMFRKALESTIKVRVQQEDLPISILQNEQGDELKLSKKLNVLLEHELISNNLKNEIASTIKWFGDSSVHTKMPIVAEDVRKSIEPVFRKLLAEFELKS